MTTNPTDTELNELAHKVLDQLQKATYDQRVDFLYTLRSTYCPYCGDPDGLSCQCSNDE